MQGTCFSVHKQLLIMYGLDEDQFQSKLGNPVTLVHIRDNYGCGSYLHSP